MKHVFLFIALVCFGFTVSWCSSTKGSAAQTDANGVPLTLIHQRGNDLLVHKINEDRFVHVMLTTPLDLSEQVKMNEVTEERIVLQDVKRNRLYQLEVGTGLNGLSISTGTNFARTLVREKNGKFMIDPVAGDIFLNQSCNCIPATADATPCKSGGEGASSCSTGETNGPESNGCVVHCAKGYNACCPELLRAGADGKFIVAGLGGE